MKDLIAIKNKKEINVSTDNFGIILPTRKAFHCLN